jgi:nitrite reductase/ring-hydroxylating ferredoxin subunit
MTCCDRLQQGPDASSTAARRFTDRRGVLRSLAASVAGLLLGMRAAFAQKKLALGLDKVEKLKSPGGAAVLKIQNRDLLFIRESEDSVRVLDPTCTHKRCTVEYSREKQRIVCPCHGSNFALDGRVLNGPAEKPLQAFEAALDEQKTRIIFSVE